MRFLLVFAGALRFTVHMPETTSPAALLTSTDRCNESVSEGWVQDHDGTWTALTHTRSKSGFKTERGAKGWFMRKATDSAKRRLGPRTLSRRPETTMLTWTPTADGYSLDGHALSKVGRRWLLTFPGGRVEDLGTLATFDTAEAAIVAAAN